MQEVIWSSGWYAYLQKGAIQGLSGIFKLISIFDSTRAPLHFGCLCSELLALLGSFYWQKLYIYAA